MTPLSPAAQAVLDAIADRYSQLATMSTAAAAAAALQAVAPLMECVQDHQKLLAIAAELDGTTTPTES